MTRGRRKDLTIPPSRALLQQRDYRARKAQYVADLEDRLRRSDEENAKLRKELDALRARATVPGNVGPSPEVVTVSAELMQKLTSTASCIARFQQLTFTEQNQAQAAAQAHALAQAQLQTQNLQPHSPSTSNELPPIRAPSLNETHVQLPPPTSFAGPPSHAASRQPTPPRVALHPSRHSQPLEFHHHNPLGSPPPLHVPNTTQRREYLHPSQMDTARPTPVPSSSSASSSTSVSTSPTSSRQTLSRARADSYTGYNEIDTACWGYFDSRDLSQDDEDDEEDELYEEETHTTRSVLHVHHRTGRSPARANGDRLDHGGRSSSSMVQRTSDMRSTASSSGTEDTPMRMREDSPMRTR